MNGHSDEYFEKTCPSCGEQKDDIGFELDNGEYVCGDCYEAAEARQDDAYERAKEEGLI